MNLWGFLSPVLCADVGKQSFRFAHLIICLLIHLRSFRLSSLQDAEIKVLLWKEISKQVHRIGSGYLCVRWEGGCKEGYILIKM